MLPSYKLLSFTSWKHNVCRILSAVSTFYISSLFAPQRKKDIWKDVTFSLDFTSSQFQRYTKKFGILTLPKIFVFVASKVFSLVYIFSVPDLFFVWVCNLFLISGYKRQISWGITRLSFVICYLNHNPNQNKITPVYISLI